MLLPNYFLELELIVTPETLGIVTRIESAFTNINYSDHHEHINGILEYQRNLNSNDIASEVIEVYRDSVVSVLTRIGITLANPLVDLLSDIADIITVISLLSTVPLSDVTDTTFLNNEDPLEMLSTILMDINGFSKTMMLVASVSPVLIDTLLVGEDLGDVRTKIVTPIRARFLLQLGSDRSGIMYRYVKNTSNLAYDLDLVAAVVADDIDDIKDVNTMVMELKLLVLGSVTNIEGCGVEFINMVELIVSDIDKVLAINSRNIVFEELL